MLVNTGRRTISREEEQRQTAAFLARHREQRLTCLSGDDAEEGLEILAAMRRARPRRVLGAAQGVPVKRERVVTGDLEECLVPVSQFPVNRERVGG